MALSLDNVEVYCFDAFGTHSDIFILNAGERIRQHLHNRPHAVFVAKGQVLILIGPVPKTLSAGDQLIAPEGVFHSIEALSDSVVISLAPKEIE